MMKNGIVMPHILTAPHNRCAAPSRPARRPKSKKPPGARPAAFVQHAPERTLSVKLTLRELFCATCFAQTNFFTFDFTCIAGHEAGFGQIRFQRCIVVDQGAGDAVANCASLAGLAAAVDVDLDVETLDIAGQFQWLTNNHHDGFAGEVLSRWLAVNDDLASANFDEHASHCTLATAGAVIVVTDHVSSLENE